METNLWTYPETVGRLDLTGFGVEATDGSIGKVDEATRDADASFLVVDTGPSLFRKRVLLPAGLVKRVDRDEETIYVSRTKDEIKQSPEFDNANYQGDEYRADVSDYYLARLTSDSEVQPKQEDRPERVDKT
jgi:hypothetical protein